MYWNIQILQKVWPHSAIVCANLKYPSHKEQTRNLSNYFFFIFLSCIRSK